MQEPSLLLYIKYGCNLVFIDKRTRYPEVEVVYSTGIKPTKEKLKKIFATHGTPIHVESDNGRPFQSNEFPEFAAIEGFRHHRITPLHPRTEGTNTENLTNDGYNRDAYRIWVNTTHSHRDHTM